VLNAPDGVFIVSSLSGTGAVSPQGTNRPSNVMDCSWEFHMRHRVVLPSESVQQPNHQPRFQPNGTYGASSQTEVLGMSPGLRAFQLDHMINNPTAQATTTNALSAMRMEWFYIDPRGSVDALQVSIGAKSPSHSSTAVQDHLDNSQIVVRKMIPTARKTARIMVLFTISRFGSSGSVDL